jgi:hypothetical protein
MAPILRCVAIVLFAFVLFLPPPSFAQAPGYVRVNFVKAGLVAGVGAGRGVLAYRGRNYRFTATGQSLGITVGATASRLEGWASGIRDVRDFAGTYSAVGAGGALVGGAGGVSLRNEKGVVLDLKGPRAGLEFAANLSRITISLR